MSIENLYFPLFLVVMAVFVVWVFSRISNSDNRRPRDRRKSSSRKVRESAKLQRSITPAGPAVPHPPKHGLKTQDAMWRSRRQRAKHGAISADDVDMDGNVFQATYLDPSKTWDQRDTEDKGIGEQQVRDTEYTGLDEYLARKAAEKKAKEAEQEHELSMTAVKFEPADSASEESEDSKKQARFKP